MHQDVELILKHAPAGHRYNEQSRVLVLRGQSSFSVTLRRYAQEAARIQAGLDQKNAENREGIAALQRYYDRNNADGVWTDEERENHRANLQRREESLARLRREVAALEADRQRAVAALGNVRWCWRVAGAGSNAQAISANPGVAAGLNPDGTKTFHFPSLLEGGGLCRLEAFREGAGAGASQAGMLVQATGRPRVLRCEWTDADFNPIQGPVGFGSEVLLHVYTGGLFGQEVSVGLLDRDLFTFNDTLNISSAQAFTAEVNVHPVEPFEAGKPGVGALLPVPPNAEEGTPATRESYVQKIMLEVLIDPAWEQRAGSSLRIYPVVRRVRDGGEFEGFERAYLDVNKEAQRLDAPEVEFTNNPVQIGQVETRVEAFSPCRYETITIKDGVGTPAETTQVLYNAAHTVEPGALVYETLAPSNEASPKRMSIQWGSLDVSECKLTSRPHQRAAVVTKAPDPPTTQPLEGETLALSVWSDNNLALLRARPEVFFFSPDAVKRYSVEVPTCAQPGNVVQLAVYPEIERELVFVLTLFRSLTTTPDRSPQRREYLPDFHRRKGFRIITDEIRADIQATGGLAFGLQAKVKIDQTVSSVELASTRSQIRRLVGFYHRVQQVIEPFDGRGKESSSVAYRLGIYRECTFTLDPPNVAFIANIKNKKLAGVPKVVSHWTGAVALKPITKFTIGVDLLTLVQYLGVGGKIADWIKERIEGYFNVSIYMIFSVSVSADFEINYTYNRIEGLSGTNLKIAPEFGAELKIGVESREVVLVPVVYADGRIDQQRVPRHAAEGGVSASFIYTYEMGSDGEGRFTQHKLEFTGVKATITLYSIRNKMTYSQQMKREFTIMDAPAEPLYQSPKERSA